MIGTQLKAGYRTRKLEVKTARELQAELNVWVEPDERIQGRAKLVAGDYLAGEENTCAKASSQEWRCLAVLPSLRQADLRCMRPTSRLKAWQIALRS